MSAVAEVEELAEAVGWLCSTAAFITGQHLTIGGGFGRDSAASVWPQPGG